MMIHITLQAHADAHESISDATSSLWLQSTTHKSCSSLGTFGQSLVRSWVQPQQRTCKSQIHNTAVSNLNVKWWCQSSQNWSAYQPSQWSCRWMGLRTGLKPSISAAGNWTRVFRVTGGNTNHYTTTECDALHIRCIVTFAPQAKWSHAGFNRGPYGN